MEVKVEANKISLEASKRLISCNVYTLEVPNFFTLPGYKYGGFVMSSPSFEFEDATWCFRCHSQESPDVINSFSFDILRTETEYSKHNVFFKIALLKANNRKCDDSKCGKIEFNKTCSNQQLHCFINNDYSSYYHDGYDPLTIIVHLFPVETIEVDARQALLKKDSPHKKAIETKDCKMSLKLTKKTVSSDFYLLKLPKLELPCTANIRSIEINSSAFKFANATCCFHFRYGHYFQSYDINLKVLNAEKPLQNIFMRYILMDSNDKVVGNEFKVLLLTKISQKNNFLDLGHIPSFPTPFYTIHIHLLCEELEMDTNVPVTKNRASVPSSSTNQLNSAISTSQPSSAASVSVPSVSTDESNSAENASQPSSDISSFGLLAQDFKKLFLNGVDCDLTLKVTEKEFKVHRAILRARSQVFEAMLSHDMIEQNKGIIDIPDIDAQAMEVLLTYVYSGEVDSLSEENVLGVYYAADKYNMAFLKNECSELIQKLLSPTIICDAIQLALNHNDRDLLECCTEYFVVYISDILPTVKWMSFMKANPIAANELLIKATKK